MVGERIGDVKDEILVKMNMEKKVGFKEFFIVDFFVVNV